MRRPAMWTIQDRACECEAEINANGDVGDPVSYCSEHHLNGVSVYTCGECGFASWHFERLERHVYGVHLGVDVTDAPAQFLSSER
ncbi:MAG: hypothetical protein ACRDKW_06330 [Actinomycetota bacterium]